MALGRSGRALERLLGGLERSVGGSWRGLGCHVGAQDGSEIQKILKKSGSKRQAVPQRFLIEFVSKINSWGDPKVCI